VIEADYMTAADTDSAIAAFNLELNAVFSGLSDDVDAAEAAVANIEADYMTAADTDSAIAAFNLELNAVFSGLSDDVDAAEADIDQAEADILSNATASASADRALARRLDALTASLAGVSAGIEQSVAVLVEDGRAIARLSERLYSELDGSLAVIEADYMTAADTDSAIAAFNLELNAVFSGLSDDVDAAEAAVANIEADYMTAADTDSAIAAFDMSLNAGFSSLSDDVDDVQDEINGVPTVSPGLSALVDVLAGAMVDQSDPDNPVARAFFEIITAASGGAPGILRMLSESGGSEMFLAASEILLANLGVGEDEEKTVMKASGGIAAFNEVIWVLDDLDTPTSALLLGPAFGSDALMLWAGDYDDADTPTIANCKLAFDDAGEVFLNGSAAGALANLDQAGTGDLETNAVSNGDGNFSRADIGSPGSGDNADEHTLVEVTNFDVQAGSVLRLHFGFARSILAGSVVPVFRVTRDQSSFPIEVHLRLLRDSTEIWSEEITSLPISSAGTGVNGQEYEDFVNIVGFYRTVEVTGHPTGTYDFKLVATYYREGTTTKDGSALEMRDLYRTLDLLELRDR
jgi:RNA-binding protein YlmH